MVPIRQRFFSSFPLHFFVVFLTQFLGHTLQIIQHTALENIIGLSDATTNFLPETLQICNLIYFCELPEQRLKIACKNLHFAYRSLLDIHKSLQYFDAEQNSKLFMKNLQFLKEKLDIAPENISSAFEQFSFGEEHSILFQNLKQMCNNFIILSQLLEQHVSSGIDQYCYSKNYYSNETVLLQSKETLETIEKPINSTPGLPISFKSTLLNQRFEILELKVQIPESVDEFNELFADNSENQTYLLTFPAISKNVLLFDDSIYQQINKDDFAFQEKKELVGNFIAFGLLDVIEIENSQSFVEMFFEMFSDSASFNPTIIIAVFAFLEE